MYILKIPENFWFWYMDDLKKFLEQPHSAGLGFSVETLYFEDLRSFQGRRGMGRHSWNLSTNLWGTMIEGVRYRREALGHRNGGVWLVNPAWTSQTCHSCGERGVRVQTETSTIEEKGGKYFYCSKCDRHFHADVNAARNIMHVQQPLEPTAVGGWSA
jgi:transposase